MLLSQRRNDEKINPYSREARQFCRGGPVRWEPENFNPRLDECSSCAAAFLFPKSLSGRGMAFGQVLSRWKTGFPRMPNNDERFCETFLKINASFSWLSSGFLSPPTKVDTRTLSEGALLGKRVLEKRLPRMSIFSISGTRNPKPSSGWDTSFLSKPW